MTINVYPDETPVAIISRTPMGWSMVVNDKDGNEWASGTAPTVLGVLDMVTEYLTAGHCFNETVGVDATRMFAPAFEDFMKAIDNE